MQYIAVLSQHEPSVVDMTDVVDRGGEPLRRRCST